MARSLKEFEYEQGAPSSTEIITPSAAGEPAVKEDVVIIGGKERPLKNYEAELRRKADEEKERYKQELEQKIASQQPPQQTQQSWYDMVQQRAEQEMAMTGKAVPLQTILEVANSLYERNVSKTLTTRDSADKEVRNFKRSIKKDPDFNDLEDDFDSLVEQLRPEQINSPTLEVILNSVRGKRVNELVKKAEEKGKEMALKDTQILGAPTETVSSGTPPKTSLTAEQRSEIVRMNSENTMEWTEQEYLNALIKKQNRFKAAGAKNIPQLMNDTMIK
jgi:hypothetical protein